MAHSLKSTITGFALLFAIVGISFVVVSGNSSSSIVKTGSPPPWIGIRGTDLTPAIAKAAGISQQSGFLITNISAGSPAEKSGLKGGDRLVSIGGQGQRLLVGGDVITEIDGHHIVRQEQIQSVILQKHAGDVIHLSIARGSAILQIAVTLEVKPR